MSNKPRANQISLNTTSFSRNLSINDNDLQKAFNTIDQLTAGSGTSIHNSLLGIQGGSDADGYYHLTHTQYNGLLDGYNNGWSVLKGGTGITGYTSGDLLYASAANTLSKLPKSTDGYYLQLVGGLPSWKINTGSSLVLGRDLSNTINDAYVVGFNKISLDTTKEVGDGYAYLYSSLSSKFVPTKINNSYIITVGKHGLVTPNATNYLLSNFNESTDETTKAFLAPVAGTLSNLICYCNTAPGGSETVVITVRKNEVDTAITATLTGSDISAFDIIHLANIGSGDKITFKSVTSSGCAAKDLFVSLLFTIPSTNAALPSFGFYIVPIDIVFNAGQSINTSNNSMRVSSRTIDFSQYPIMSDYKVRTAKFVAILEAQGSSGTTANIELFDATNSVTITGSALSTILNSPTYLTSAALTMGTSSGNLRIDANTLYDVRLAMTNNNLTTDAVICCYSALIITYV